MALDGIACSSMKSYYPFFYSTTWFSYIISLSCSLSSWVISALLLKHFSVQLFLLELLDSLLPLSISPDCGFRLCEAVAFSVSPHRFHLLCVVVISNRLCFFTFYRMWWCFTCSIWRNTLPNVFSLWIIHEYALLSSLLTHKHVVI